MFVRFSVQRYKKIRTCGAKGYRDNRDYRDHRDHRDFRDHRDYRDHRDFRDHRDYRDAGTTTKSSITFSDNVVNAPTLLSLCGLFRLSRP